MDAVGKFFAFALLAVSFPAGAEVAFPDRGLTADPAKTVVVRHEAPHHRVVVDPTPFDRSTPGTVLALPGTDGAPIHARFEGLRADTDGNRTWIGRVDTETGPQSVVITFGPDAVFGFIPQRTGPALELTTLAGTEWIVEASPNPPRPPKSDAIVPSGREIPMKATGETEYVCAAADCRGQVPLIDVLVVYSADVIARFGTEAAVRTRIAQYEQLTNQAWFDSEAGVEMRVVASSLVDYSGYELIEKALSDMYNPAGTPLKTQVDALRAEYGADLVTMLRDIDKTAFNGTCGIAYIGGFSGTAYNPARGYAANVVGYGGCPELTFTHELGHNLGSAHDQQTLDETGEAFAGHFAYSRGHRAGGFSTVMGYPGPGQAHLALLSNPRLGACQAQPCGIAGFADNARSHTDGAADVSAYFPTVIPVQGRLYISDAVVREGHSGTRELVFTICLSRPSTSPVTFDVETEDGTAQAGSDYVSKALTDVTLAPGQTSTTFTVVVNGDTVDETDETLSVWLRDPIGAPIVRSRATGTIENDDTTLTIEDVATYEDDEGSKLLDFHVRLSVPVHEDVSFRFFTVDGSADAPVDYVARNLLDQKIVAGETLAMYGIRINGDTDVEPDETFSVRATSVVNAKVGRGTATGTIRKDDTSIAIDDVRVHEGSGVATFTVTALHAPVKPVSFRIRTADGTATGGRDYTPMDEAGQTLPPGQTSRQYHVAIAADQTVEPDERFFVRLSEVVDAKLADGQGVGTITDDDLGAAVIRTIGGGGTDGEPGRDARLAAMSANYVATGIEGDVWYSDRSYANISRIRADGRLERMAGNGEAGAWGQGEDRPATTVPIGDPMGLSIGPDGTAYFVESGWLIRAILPDGTLRRVVGGGDVLADAPTPVADVRLEYTTSVAVDPAGNLYWAETNAHRVRRLGTDGIVRTIAGVHAVSGSDGDGGPATAAHLNAPQDVAVDAAGRVYIADTGNHRLRVIDPDGTIRTLAGDGYAQSSGDGGPAAQARVNAPKHLDAADDGTVFFTDADGVVRRITPGGVIHTVAGNLVETTVVADGQPATAGRVLARDVAAGVDGEFFIAAGSVRRVGRLGLPDAPRIGDVVAGDGFATVAFAPPLSNGGAPVTGYLVETLGGAGTDRDRYQPALAHRVEGLSNGVPYRFRVRAINEFGIGDASEDSETATPTPTALPAVSIDDAVVAESTSSLAVTVRLNRTSASTVTMTLSTVDGTASAGEDYTALVNRSVSIGAGQTTATVYLNLTADTAEEADETLTLRLQPVSGVELADGEARVTLLDDDFAARTIHTVAGNGSAGMAEEGALAVDAPLASIPDLAVAPDGSTVFIENYRVRRLTADGRIETLAGTGVNAESADGGLAPFVSLRSPERLAVDPRGHVYVATGNRIRRIAPDGTIHAVTRPDPTNGVACPASGPMPAARLQIYARSLATDAAGNLYAAYGCAIWRIDRGGLAVPVTGRLGSGDDGDGGLAIDARFTNISDIGFAPDGSLLVQDTGTGKLRRIGPDGVVHAATSSVSIPSFDSLGRAFIASGNRIYRRLETGAVVAVAGSGSTGFSGDGGPALSAMLASPQLLVVDGGDNLRFLDRDNRRLRHVGAGGLPGAPSIVGVTPGSGRANLVIAAPESDGGHRIREYVVVGEPTAGTDLQAGTAGLSRVLTGLENGRSHRFAVRARNDVGLGPPSAWTGWIKPGEALPPALTIDDAELAEGADGTSSMTFTVRLSGPAPADGVTFDIATADGTARAGSDYVARSVTGLKIPAGATSRGFAVAVNGDTNLEKDETFTVAASAVSGATRADGTATGTIRNDDGRRLAVADVTLDEGDEGTVTAEFVVTLSQPNGGEVRFHARAVEGSAGAVDDFAPFAADVVVPPGETRVVVPVRVVADRAVEADETFDLVLSDAVGASLADPVGRATVRNDDHVLPVLRISDTVLEEGHSGSRNAVFDITLSEPAPHPVTVVVQTLDHSAVAGSDYVAREPTTVTFPPGQVAERFIVAVRGDTTAEKDEELIVALVRADGALVADGRGFAKLLNDDSRLSVADITLAEGSYGADRPLTVEVKLLGQPAIVPVTFTVRTVEGTASTTADTPYNIFHDFVALAPTTVTIPVGQTGVAVPLQIRGDMSAEPDQEFRVVIADPVGATIADGDATIRFLDDDVARNSASVVAGNGTAGYAGEYVSPTTSLNGPVAVTADGNGVLHVVETGGNRIRRISGSSMTTFAGGTSGFAGDGGPATSASFSFLSDAVFDPEGNLYIADTGNHRVRRVATDGTITTFAGTGSSAYAGDGGTALSTALPSPRGLAFDPAGRLLVTSGGAHRVLRIDLDGTVHSIAGTGTAGYSGDGGPATAAQLNSPLHVAVAPDGTIYFTESGKLRRIAPDGTIDTVRAVVAPYGTSYNEVIPTSLPVLVLQSPYGVAAASDGSVYVTESHRVLHVKPSGIAYALVGETTAGTSAELLKLNSPRGVMLRGRDLHITEAGTHRLRKVSADRLPGAPVAVSVTPGDASATMTITPPTETGSTPIYRYTVRSIPAGVQDLIVGTDPDALERPLTGLVNGTTYVFEVRAGNGTGWGEPVYTAPITPGTAATVDPTISIADVTVSEGDTDRVAMFTVRLSRGSTAPVTFDIGTADGTARAAGAAPDYTRRTVTGVTLPPGYLTYSFPVTVIADDANEGDEVFTVTLTNVEGARLGDTQAVGRIRDDDPLALSVDDIVVEEGDGEAVTARFTVRLNGTAPAPVSYTIATADGTARADRDYVARAPSTQTIAEGGSARVYTVNLIGDLGVEGDETFSVVLSSPTGAAIADGTGVATIADDDVPRLSIADVSLVEGDGGTTNAVLTVRLSAPAPGPVTYSIRTVNGTAVSGSDFAGRNFTGQTIDTGGTARSFVVPVTGDTTVEADETFEVRVSSVTGARITDSIAVVTIRDDDDGAAAATGAPARAPAPAAFAARDDRVVLVENAPATAMDVLANDVYEPGSLAGGSLAISERGRGEVDVDDRGTTDAGDDRVRYRAPRDTAGPDAFGYRVCAADGRCAEALVQVESRPALDVDAVSRGDRGHVDLALGGLRPLARADWQATPLVGPRRAAPPLAADPTPASPWDADGAGTAALVGSFAPGVAGGQATLLVDAHGERGDIDLYLGLDLDRDGRPDRDETRCTAAMSAVAERCEVVLQAEDGRDAGWWILVHNRDAGAQPARIAAFVVPDAESDGTLVAAGPATVGECEAFALRVDWLDPALAEDDARAGYVRLFVDGVEAGRFPVRIDRPAAGD